MPVYSVQFAVPAAPITIARIHTEDQAQAIAAARDWATHVLQTVGHACALGESLEATEVAP